MSAFDHLDDLHPMCDRGCGRTMDDCYEAEDGADCDGGELWQEVNRLNAEAGLLRAELARAKPVLDAAQAWRRWFPSADSMFAPENALVAAVDGWKKPTPDEPGEEPELIIYQAWDTDEIGWSDNGMSGTDVEAVKLGALESFVEWSIEENWCGDPDELDRYEAELREGLHWRQFGNTWELHRGTGVKQGRSTWQGINVYATKVGRETVAEMQAKCAKARSARLVAEGLSSTDTTPKAVDHG